MQPTQYVYVRSESWLEYFYGVLPTSASESELSDTDTWGKYALQELSIWEYSRRNQYC